MEASNWVDANFNTVIWALPINSAGVCLLWIQGKYYMTA